MHALEGHRALEIQIQRAEARVAAVRQRLEEVKAYAYGPFGGLWSDMPPELILLPLERSALRVEHDIQEVRRRQDQTELLLERDRLTALDTLCRNLDLMDKLGLTLHQDIDGVETDLEHASWTLRGEP